MDKDQPSVLPWSTYGTLKAMGNALSNDRRIWKLIAGRLPFSPPLKWKSGFGRENGPEPWHLLGSPVLVDHRTTRICIRTAMHCWYVVTFTMA